MQQQAVSITEVISKLRSASGSGSKAHSRSSSSTTSSSSARRPPLPQTHVDERLWQECMPAGFKFYSDKVNQRHQGYNKHVGTCARAWQLYGPRTSALLVVQWAWKRAMDLSYESANPYEEELASLCSS